MLLFFILGLLLLWLMMVFLYRRTGPDVLVKSELCFSRTFHLGWATVKQKENYVTLFSNNIIIGIILYGGLYCYSLF